MNEKKIEPTDAMVEAGASSAWEEANPGILGWTSISERHKEGCRRDARAVLTAALNHPDAAELFADEDARPWEPLNEWDPVRVGDEVRQELNGVTTIAVVGRVDGEGDPWTAEDRFIGVHDEGTWRVRRAVQQLPTEDGAVIVPADGCQFIETRTGKKSRRLTWDADAFVWYDAYGTYLGTDITSGTWKVDDQ